MAKKTKEEEIEVKEKIEPKEYKLIAALPRLGDTHVNMPDGSNKVIPLKGEWVESELADFMLAQTKDIYCTRRQGVITVKPVYEMRATAQQLLEKPN